MEEQKKSVKALLKMPAIDQKFEDILGDKKSAFFSSLLQIVSSNARVAQCDGLTVINAAATAAILDLPINQNFGYAWIIPYNVNEKIKDEKTGRDIWKKTLKAQFQMGYKGYVQLALRTNQYHKINCVPVYKTQFKSYNPMTEFLDADFTQPEEGEVVGYVAYFRLIGGFEKLVYWNVDKVRKHAQRYSKSYGKKTSNWQDDFDSMGLKTVLKSALSKWGLLSVDLQTAILADQSIQPEQGKYQYIDNPDKGINIEQTDHDKEKARILAHIKGAKSIDELQQVLNLVSEYDLADEYDTKSQEFRTEQ